MRSFTTPRIVRGIAAPAAMSIGLLFALSACGGDANEAETAAETAYESAYESSHEAAEAAIEAAHDAMEEAVEHGEAMLHDEDEHHDDDEEETSYP